MAFLIIFFYIFYFFVSMGNWDLLPLLEDEENCRFHFGRSWRRIENVESKSEKANNPINLHEYR